MNVRCNVTVKLNLKLQFWNSAFCSNTCTCITISEGSSFDWGECLNDTPATAASVSSFKHVSILAFHRWHSKYSVLSSP